MNFEEVISTYDRDGFVIIRQLFSAGEVAEYENELQRCIQEVAPGAQSGDVYFDDSTPKCVKAMHRLDHHSELFNDLISEPRIQNILQAIWLGDQVIPGKVSLFDKPSSSSGDTPPHQDNTFQYWNPPLALTVTLAIDETTSENSPLIFLKGSHHLGLLPHCFSEIMGFSRTLVDPIDEVQYPSVELCMQPGDVALHHILSVHRANINHSGRSRRQIAVGYRSSRAVCDEAAYAQYQKDLDALHAQSMRPGM